MDLANKDSYYKCYKYTQGFQRNHEHYTERNGRQKKNLAEHLEMKSNISERKISPNGINNRLNTTEVILILEI